MPISHSQPNIGHFEVSMQSRSQKVRALLCLSDDRACSCDEVDRIANAHLKEVEDKIADLKRLQSELQDMIGQCRRGTIADCRIIEALGHCEVNNAVVLTAPICAAKP